MATTSVFLPGNSHEQEPVNKFTEFAVRHLGRRDKNNAYSCRKEHTETSMETKIQESIQKSQRKVGLACLGMALYQEKKRGDRNL